MDLKKIAIDISALDPDFKEHATRGIGRYAREMHKFFSTEGFNKYVDFFDHSQVLKKSSLGRLIDFLPAGRQTLKQQLLYPLRLNCPELKDYSCLHFLAQTDAPTWCPKKYIITVHDLIPLRLPQLYKANNPGWRYELARYFELQAIRNAAGILAISENTKRDIVSLLNIPEEKIFVTHLGVDYEYFSTDLIFDPADVRQEYRINSEDFILYVGGIDPRKNYQGLIESFALLIESLKKQEIAKLPVLVFVGKIEQDKEYPRLLELIKAKNLVELICFAGFVPDNDLLKLYKSCAAFCFLSLYEGFGLTPLEALAAGAPVVSSCVSAMPEVLGQAAILVDPQAPADCAIALEMLIKDKSKRLQFKERGMQQAKNFTWQKCGEQTYKAYQYFNVL